MTSKYTSQQQFSTMINFMEKHWDISKGKLSRKLWDELVDLLNSQGPPSKDLYCWRKVWTDYKYVVKEKSKREKKMNHKCKPGSKRSLNEEKLIRLLAMSDDPSDSTEFCLEAPLGATNQEEEVEKYNIEYTEDVSNCPYLEHHTVDLRATINDECHSKKRKKESIKDLLGKEIDRQEIFYSNMLELMKERNELLRERNQIEKSKEQLLRRKIIISESRLQIEIRRVQVEEENAKRNGVPVNFVESQSLKIENNE